MSVPPTLGGCVANVQSSKLPWAYGRWGTMKKQLTWAWVRMLLAQLDRVFHGYFMLILTMFACDLL